MHLSLGATSVLSLVLAFVVLMFFAVLFGVIFRKAGRSAAWAVLMFVPLVNLLVMVWFAFSEWPVQKELDRLRAAAASPSQPTEAKKG
ncbi:MAG TPA: hypothetical protein VEW69_10815 [Alphaproteobacteria bacterium]|nr:hypothetical protein [Alphaproteobacteria bacterium]